MIALQSRFSYLNEIARYSLYGLDPDLLEQYAGRIKAITVEEIKSVARRYFTLDRRAMGVVRGQGDPSLTR